MAETSRRWALILAGGDGKRLRPLTTRSDGATIPKQFCSLRGLRTLFEDAVVRAASVAQPSHVCTILTMPHERWWRPLIADWPRSNVIVQPANRGTGIGILYSLLQIVARDPDATVVILPSDHFVLDETSLRTALADAVHCAERDRTLTLIGIEPDEVEPELGYILPATRGARVSTIARFVEKPDAFVARRIIHDGALWNTLIMAAPARKIVDLFLRRHAPLVVEIKLTLERANGVGLPQAAIWSTLTQLYARLPSLDFARDILEPHSQQVNVLRATRCGWSDIGTPARVGIALKRLPAASEADATASYAVSAPLNLAAQHAQLDLPA